ncbi:hypothetical protein BJ165DRAFT_1525812 [Panaeolus papilionaceus]|nr:hypothetical protein BJ165DRAFT_1525812 [Panaeolus papilionaceus]
MEALRRLSIFFFIGLSLLSLASAADELEPALGGNDAEFQSRAIRGLLFIDKRQSTCGNWVRCGALTCCPTSAWRCCSTGDCCRPGTHCDMGSNGIMGCCRDGAICAGPAPPPSSTTRTSTSTRTVTIPNTPRPPPTTTRAPPPPPPPTSTPLPPPPPPPPVSSTSPILSIPQSTVGPPRPTPTISSPPTGASSSTRVTDTFFADPTALGNAGQHLMPFSNIGAVGMALAVTLMTLLV